jgi:hypothetical protein
MASIREFRDQATKLLKERQAILVTRRGRIIGFFLPATGAALPPEVKRELFYGLTDEIRGAMKLRGVREETALGEFEASRKALRRL